MNDKDIVQLALEHFGAVLKPSDLEVQLAVLAVAIEREACARADGEREKEIAELRSSLDFYKRRVHALQKAQQQMRDPERTIVCDILANGHLLEPAGGRYTAPLAALVAAAEREKVAAWMRSKSYATGHGDTVEDLLKELEWQVAEREREACAKVCDEKYEAVPTNNPYAEADGDYSELIYAGAAQDCADAIRARGEV